MNSADQGVFPMDTAFKRRWDFEYLGIDDNDEEIKNKKVTLTLKDKSTIQFEWNSLRKAINNFLSDNNINEDKQMGPYFINVPTLQDGCLDPQDEFLDPEVFASVFKTKVLMYLFEDAARHKRSELFKGTEQMSVNGVMKNCARRYSDLCKAFDDYGIKIFHEKIVNEGMIKESKNNVELTGPVAKAEPGNNSEVENNQ